ncbi:MAG: molybdenum cofactor guanylyltransferase [Planctomycetota bacterium]|nr:MAG: molybdenum cofactor guanylyltransferase [Planctomycetota bacterium]
MRRGAIILCGGRSSRMGLPKLALPFGPESMLGRIVRLAGEACESIVVAAAVEQELPPLPAGVLVARDARPQRGPLEGIAAALAALPDDVEAAFATGCDVPLLEPALVRRMFELLGEDAAAVPNSDGFLHPLAAVYRKSLVDVIEVLLATDRLRAADLFDVVATRRVEESELRDVDPQLDSLRNVNTPGEYVAALESAGYAAAPDVLAQLQV